MVLPALRVYKAILGLKALRVLQELKDRQAQPVHKVLLGHLEPKVTPAQLVLLVQLVHKDRLEQQDQPGLTLLLLVQRGLQERAVPPAQPGPQAKAYRLVVLLDRYWRRAQGLIMIRRG